MNKKALIMVAILVYLAPQSAWADSACEMNCYTKFEEYSLMCRTANESDLKQCKTFYTDCMDSCLFGHIGLCGHQCRSDYAECLTISGDAYGRCVKLIINDTLECLVGCGWDVGEG